MGDYLIPVTDAHDNVIYTADGRIVANYLLTGINVSPYLTSTITSGQERNKQLLRNLSMVASPDMLLLGIKTRSAPEEIIQRVLDGVPHLDERNDTDLLTQIDEFYRKLVRGDIEEFQRLYILSVEIGTAATGAASAAKISGTDPFADIDKHWVARREAALFDLIPSEFVARRTTPELLRWAHERMRLRGIEVPAAPTAATEHTFRPKGFTNVIIDKAADTRPVFDEFVAAMKTGEVPAAPKRLLGRFRENYQAIRYGQCVSVCSPESRTETMPDGPVSFQTLMAIESYPTAPQNVLNTFTYLVDQDIGVDADFALRFSFDQDAISVDETRQFLKTLDAEIDANAVDEFDARAYDNRRRERRLLDAHVAQESGPRAMEVAAIFAFAHPNRTILARQVRAIRELFEENRFTVTVPVGGQFDLLKMMLPGSACTKLGRELKGTTTVHAFSACIPIRSSRAGDLRGLPIAINTENALGQIILHDYYGATEGGSGSIAVTGDQGSGKSYFHKRVIGDLSDLNLNSWVIDNSPQGEYVVYGQQLRHVDIVDVTNPERSIDPLKTLPADQAGPLFLDLMLPLLGLEPSSREARLLGHILKPANRQVHGIESSRDLITYLGRNNGSTEADNLHRQLEFWADQTYARVIFDPIGQDNRVRRLPAFTPDGQHVVFRTHGVQVIKGELRHDTEPSRRFGRVLYTAIAALAAHYFSLTSEPCAFLADEVSFLEGSNVPELLLRDQDRTGRKAGNFIVAGTQLATDLLDGNYDLIKQKIVLRQETRDNAIAAFNWIGIPPTEAMIEKMMTDTSPRDPQRQNRAVAGREGEGWFGDGAAIVRVKMLRQMTEDRHRFANTTTSEMIRVGDLPALAMNGSHG